MNQIRRWFSVFVAVAAGACAMPVGAVEWLNDNSLTNVVTETAPGQFTVNVGGEILKVRAYSAPSIGSTSGNWVAASVGNVGGGFGVSNTVQPESGLTENSTDNIGVVDILVLELPELSAGWSWDLDAFRLGFASESSGGTADVQAWFGGSGLASNYDFTQVCFTGCTGSAQSLAMLGITPQDAAGGENAFYGGNIAQGAVVPVNYTQAGRYLVMAGRLGDQDDNFKLDMLKATAMNYTPVPGTLALLGLGLIGLGSMRRRAARA